MKVNFIAHLRFGELDRIQVSLLEGKVVEDYTLKFEFSSESPYWGEVQPYLSRFVTSPQSNSFFENDEIWIEVKIYPMEYLRISEDLQGFLQISRLVFW